MILGLSILKPLILTKRNQNLSRRNKYMVSSEHLQIGSAMAIQRHVSIIYMASTPICYNPILLLSFTYETITIPLH
ncbi:hypothetical protein EUTSA_v10002755mg [Eutrema salsugineum]|uniref:Uncharacterized protein n=1 Tax=Eutrema salsugineum TaxID=72664 RepID=V4MXH6_EUTSA|nr:hypothetical protein EUTSA_v10002755mg [Eutrema salsugineum]